jgi:2',3'-cyclic-nucleotide 2'-phosphodiesterase (5'-nucleotidase family)
MASLSILHTNDLHGSLDDVREAALSRLRVDADLYFDTGDAIKSGNLGIPLRPEPVWERFARLGLSVFVIGNRETHVIEAGFNAKLAGAGQPILCANLRLKSGQRPLPAHVILDAKGIRVGVFGVSVAMVTERMAARVASAYIWDPPLEIAAECAAAMKPNVDVLIGLTHIGHRMDVKLAESVPGIDILLTGHSHTVLESPIRVGQTWICQGGSHGRFAGLYRWSDGELTGGLCRLT